MTEFIATLKETQAGELLIVFMVAMLPVFELRGAIPIGVAMGLDPRAVVAVAILGNLLPVPFIILFIRRIFTWLRRKSERLERLIARLERRAEGKWEQVHTYQFLGLMVLVAIPLPGTGAWTGALIAALMNMRMKTALPCIVLGVILAGIFVTILSGGVAALVGG